MSVAVVWYVKPRVLEVRFWGNVTVEDGWESERLIISHVAEGQPPVHMIADLLQVENYPTNLARIRQHLTGAAVPKLGWVVIVSANKTVRFLATLITQLIRGKFHTCASREEALVFLQDMDASLRPLLASKPDTD